MRARVYKRNGGKWYLDYTDHRGKRVRKWAAEAKTKDDAQKALRRALTREAQIGSGEIDSLDNGAGVASLVEAFLLHKIASRSYETARFYMSALGGTVGQFWVSDHRAWPPRKPVSIERLKAMKRMWRPGPLGVETVDEITVERVEQLIERERSRLSIRSLNLRVGALKALLTWARKGGRVKSNPIADMSRVGRPRKTHRALTVQEVNRLLDASDEPDRTIWLTFLHTGMRRGELVKLRWPAVCFRTHTIRVESETSKSRRQRDIPMTPELEARLLKLQAEARDPEGVVLGTRDGKERGNNLRRRFLRCLKRAGIDTGDVTIHTLRHTFATQLLLNGANPKAVSELLGHSSITITMNVYSHVWPHHKAEAMQALPYGRTQSGHREGTEPTTLPQSKVG